MVVDSLNPKSRLKSTFLHKIDLKRLNGSLISITTFNCWPKIVHKYYEGQKTGGGIGMRIVVLICTCVFSLAPASHW